jgi:hypothetical protein
VKNTERIETVVNESGMVSAFKTEYDQSIHDADFDAYIQSPDTSPVQDILGSVTNLDHENWGTMPPIGDNTHLVIATDGASSRHDDTQFGVVLLTYPRGDRYIR